MAGLRRRHLCHRHCVRSHLRLIIQSQSKNKFFGGRRRELPTFAGVLSGTEEFHGNVAPQLSRGTVQGATEIFVAEVIDEDREADIVVGFTLP